MLYLFLGIVILGCIAGAFELISQRFDGKEQPIRVQKGDCSTCSGDDSACEQVCMMQAATKDKNWIFTAADLQTATMLTKPSNLQKCWKRSALRR